MHVPCALLLASTLLAFTDGLSQPTPLEQHAASKVSFGELQTVPRSLAGTSTKRLLRTSAAANSDTDTHNEERLTIPGLSKVTELASNFRPMTQKATFWLWLRMQTTPKNVFKLLNLKQLRNSETTLDKSPELLDWLRYTMAYRGMAGTNKVYSDGEIYLRLLKLAPEKELITFFQALRRIPDLKVVSENLQTAQYKFWYKLNMKPNDVSDRLGITKLLETGALMSDPRYIVYYGYTEMWLSKVKLNRRFGANAL
ncbi:hypothetical protein PHYPSEUDO_015495 [Phytophthora pseudosyringae]|uniref:RxLR effector protein n=1 Tax=Phytophthora pseudosyringae TaxID=221518 RepID=A0A8T1VYV0_9STRA|nr:hypothetical protein PHYPSEUDO_015495 [Phytophthora pseudosyringae]